MEPIVSFRAEDVWAVAAEFLDGCVQYYETNSLGARGCGYECLYCDGFHPSSASEVRHDHDCLVLVAQDLLTGTPAQSGAGPAGA